MADVGKICVNCKQAIVKGKFCNIDGNYYHGQCFKCQICNGSMDQGFCKYKDKNYCRKCYEIDVEKNCERCHVCQKLITPGTKMMTAINKRFHEPCFKCADCGSVMHDKRVFPILGKIYCVECHWGRKIEAEGLEMQKEDKAKQAGAS